METLYEFIVRKVQFLIDSFLEGKNNMLYVINPDGSFMELQKGCTLLSKERYKMEVYIRSK